MMVTMREDKSQGVTRDERMTFPVTRSLALYE